MRQKQRRKILAAYRKFYRILRECKQLNFSSLEILSVLEGFEELHPKKAELLRKYDVLKDGDRLEVREGVGALSRLEIDLLSAIGFRRMADNPMETVGPILTESMEITAVAN